MPKQTPSQTVGPYFAYGLTPEPYGYAFSGIAGGVLTAEDGDGERIRIEGRVLDGAGAAVGDAMVEIWQADGQGRYAHPADPRSSNARFRGFGRVGTGTDPAQRFVFETVKPGPLGDGQAPHVNLVLFLRGLLSHAYTRIYFADEAEANETDPVLAAVPPERRTTLIAAREEVGGTPLYRFDIHLQGDRETVFFDV
ncbi:MAG: protocatechuate 3,4-dioxygenase subunit alpha [Kiloniellales bacterium]|nr:protocatechuate 3,4-dioxygenase subunit alpha [Kiloniellales bacterium]